MRSRRFRFATLAFMTVVMIVLGVDEYFTDHRLGYVVFDAVLAVGFALLAVAVLSRNPRIQLHHMAWCSFYQNPDRHKRTYLGVPRSLPGS
jgi:hypothetical protein